MANLSTYLADKLLDHVFGGAAYTQPTPYLALFTTAPSEPAGTGAVEVTGGAYARVALTSANVAAASAESKANDATIAFAQATAAWGTIVAMGVYDAATAGNLLASGALTTSKVVGAGDTIEFSTGNLTFTLS